MNTAIITGASSGLGRCYVDAVTKVFPEVEELWLIARREERLHEIARHYPNKRCVILPLDLSDRRSYDILAEKLQQEQPQIKYSSTMPASPAVLLLKRWNWTKCCRSLT